MSARGKHNEELVLGAEPRVNLLPPEVALRVKARATRRLLVLLVVLALAVVGGGVTASYVYALDAQSRLDAAHDRTQDLLMEQLKYSEATTVVKLLDTTLQARLYGTSTEVVWADVIDAIKRILPEGSSVEALTALSSVPWEPQLVATGPLREPRMSTLNLVIASSTVPDTTGLFRSLDTITGFADATQDSVTAVGDGFRAVYTLNFDAEALAQRFAAVEAVEESADGESAEGDSAGGDSPDGASAEGEETE